jgi:hypothetical protein
MRDDFEKRYLDYGTGPKVIHYMQVQYWDALGEPTKAAEAYRLYLKSSTNDLLDDCKACQPNKLISHFISHGKYAEALKEAEPLILGKVTCQVVPERTYPKLIFPALHLGKLEEALNFAILARKKLPLDQANLPEASHLINYYALTGEWVKGRNVIEKQFPYSFIHVSEVDQFYFYLSGHIFFHRMPGNKTKLIQLKLPANGPLYNESNKYTLEQLRTYFEQQLDLVRQALDQRNGNPYYRRLIEQKKAEMKELEAVLNSKPMD